MECLLPSPTGIYIANTYYSGALYLRWNDIPLATAYDVTIYKNYEPVYSVRMQDTQMDLRTSTSRYNRETKTFDVTEIDNPLYAQIFGSEKVRINGTIKVTAVGSDGQASLFSLIQPFIIESWANKNERIFGASDKSYFDSDAQARLSMTSVQLNIWRLSTSGVKTSAKISLLVNKNVAEDVKKIFADIYNGADYMHFSLSGT